MTLRELIIGIAVWVPTTLFASASWSESQPGGFYTTPLVIPGSPDIYTYEIRKSIDRLPSQTDRSATRRFSSASPRL